MSYNPNYESELSSGLSDMEKDMCADVLRELYVHGYIVRDFDDKSKKLFLIIRNAKYEAYIDDTLSRMGFGLGIMNQRGEEVAYIKNSTDDDGAARFKKNSSTALCCLIQLYYKQQQEVSLSPIISVEVKEILETVNIYKPMTERELMLCLFQLQDLRYVKVLDKKSKCNVNTSVMITPAIIAFFSEETEESISKTLEKYKNEVKTSTDSNEEPALEDANDQEPIEEGAEEI